MGMFTRTLCSVALWNPSTEIVQFKHSAHLMGLNSPAVSEVFLWDLGTFT